MTKKLIFFLMGVLTLMVASVATLWAWLPSAKEIRGCMVTKMYQIELCPGSKNYVPLSQVAPILQKTIILTEDSNFYNHKGFDWDAIEKNAKEGWETGAFKRGGSTITQQLAKNMFLNKDRTFIRKGLEAIITDRIEHTLSKKEILERYLNIVEFGKDIFGVKAAARYYFKKSPAELTVVESSFLAMVLPSPVKYSQSYYRKELTPFASKRLRRIVDDLYQYHRITFDEYETALTQVAYFFQPQPPPEEQLSADEVPTLEELENMETLEDTEEAEEVE